MPLRTEARAWWAEVEDTHMRERIERRRAVARQSASRSRRRPRRRPVERLGPRPDRLAAWAVLLGFLLLLAAVLSAHS